MTEPYLDPDFIERFRIGPLAPHLDAYIKLLEQQGYSKVSARAQVQAIRRFSKWLADPPQRLSDIDEATIARFRSHPSQNLQRGDEAALYRLLGMLRDRGACKPKALAVRVSAQDRVTAEYRHYLLQERGLSQATALNYVPLVA